MKKINLSLLFLVVIMSFTSFQFYGQQENDTWVFGQNKWTFNPAQPNNFSVSQIANYLGQYSTSSVSDKSTGELLFYTDGVTVFDKNGGIMSNGKYLVGVPTNNDTPLDRFYYVQEQCGGGTGTNQGTIILPKPGSTTNYYVFTNVQTNFKDCQAGNQYNFEIYNFGIQYAEIDMSTPLGTVISKNNLIQTTSTGAMTASSHGNRNDFWLNTYDQGKYKSYSVTNGGINVSAPVNSNPTNLYPKTIKISPDGSKLMAATGGGNGRKYLCNFNNFTGVVSNILDFTQNDTNYKDYIDTASGFEFSPDSNIVYFYIGTAILDGMNTYNGGLAMYNIELQQLVGFSDSYTFPSLYGEGFNMQLATNGKIYLLYYNIGLDPQVITVKDNWGVINSPNVWSPTVDPITFINAPANVENSLVFPQLIPESPECVSDLIITENVSFGQNDIQDAENTIQASNIIYGASSAEYDAGTSVTLLAGFHALNNSTFRAYIDGCEASRPNLKSKIYDENAIHSKQAHDVFKLFPNPTSGRVKIISKKDMVAWEISNQFGNVNLKGNFSKNNPKTTEIDLSLYSTGIYFLRTTLANGEIIMKTILRE